MRRHLGVVGMGMLLAACSGADGDQGPTEGSTGGVFAGGQSSAGGATATSGGASGVGGAVNAGGTGASAGAGGGPGSSGGVPSGAGGIPASGGDGNADAGGRTPGTGGAGAGGTGGAGTGGAGTGGAGTGGAGTGGACDPGTTTTAWATSCATAPATTCVAGTWTDPGSTTNDPLVCESAHFAVHSPNGTITQQQCSAATNTLETVVWPTFFGSPIYFPEPYCGSAKKYKASIVIHADSGLTGGGWGNGYMGMWIGPGATADHWGLAHEFTHAVQSLTTGLKCNDQNTCGWIYESHANWHAQQLPEYHDTNVHCSEMLVNTPHLYLGSTRDRYCNWQFMEYLKDRYCYQAVTDIWTTTRTSNDPFTNIATSRGWSTSQLNDFFGEWAMHDVTWDYRDPPPTAPRNQSAFYRSQYGSITDTSKPERRLRLARLDVLDAATRRYAVHPLQAPQRWGYTVSRLYPDAGATSVKVTFRGVVQDAAHSDFRWGLVATDASVATPRYSALQRGTDGALSFCVSPGESLFLVVVATPAEQQQVVWDQLYPTIYRYPYMVQLEGASPEGHQPNAPNPSANGARWSNGGGWVASGANVAQGAYVGPMAAVLNGTVAASARVEDHATVVGGTVSGGTVGGLTVLGSGFTVSGTARVAVSWPYGPGWFEHPQSASGNATLLGDLELRGASTSKASGAFCGFVDGTVAANCGGADVTVKPPYKWR